MAPTGPAAVIPRSLILMLSGAAQYPQERLHRTTTLDDGRTYRTFREVVMRRNPPQPTGAVFRVWFYAVTTPRQTIVMSQVTKLFFYGMPGFRGKLWLLNDKTGEFGGIYQFDTVEQAQAYAVSFAMALSKRRAKAGLFSMEVYPKAGDKSLFRGQVDPIQPVQQTAPLNRV